MQLDDLISRVLNQVIDYLPSVVAGLLLFAVGIVAAWFTKRLVVQILLILRLHRLLFAFRWAKGLSRVDVRMSLYGLFGNLCSFVVFLVFLNAAFAAMKLTVVSALIEKAVLVFPRAATALVIFGVGWLISSTAANAVRRALQREKVPRATLAAGYARAMLLIFFAAMALAELNVSREVVIIGFTVVFATLGAVTVAMTFLGGRSLLRRLLGTDNVERTTSTAGTRRESSSEL